MKLELTKLEKVSLEALLEYELDNATEEVKNASNGTYHVLKERAARWPNLQRSILK